MRLEEELKLTFSDYLCTECKKPLYFELKGKDEVCINPKCVLCSPLLRFHDANQATTLKQQMKSRESTLRLEIMRTDRRSFVSFLHQQRRAIAQELIIKGRVNFERLLAIDEMLILANSVNFVGRERSTSTFVNILRNYEQFFSQENFIEDMSNLRVLLSIDKKIYLLKFLNAVNELYRSYGIIPIRETDFSSVFKYAPIDDQVKEKVEVQLGMNMADFFEQQFDHITALKYVFERYYRTSKQHAYEPDGFDIAVLLGLFFSLKKDAKYWKRTSLMKHFERTIGGKKDFRRFIARYATSRECAPVIVHDGTWFILDKETLLFFIPYLVGRNRWKVEGQTATGEERIMRKKQKASVIFENHIRNRLRECGFTGPKKPLVVSEKNKKYEYDVIGVKENLRKIILIEAKYRDFSPSSFAGTTLVLQEVLDKDNGLLVEAIKHQARLDFFHEYSERFERELALEAPSEEYCVAAYMVTKQLPLISKYKQVLISVYDEFCEKLQQNSI
jgi:hypothetical protein